MLKIWSRMASHLAMKEQNPLHAQDFLLYKSWYAQSCTKKNLLLLMNTAGEPPQTPVCIDTKDIKSLSHTLL